MKHSFFSSPRLRRLTAVPVALAMSMTVTGALAQVSATHYTDVQAGAWYEQAVDALLSSGALDDNEVRLRPNDLATRAEVLKLLVNVYGEQLSYPTTPSFNDVPRSAWYFPYVEASAEAGWVRGDRDCYQNTRPCTARPADNVNRAEMAALLQRAYGLSHRQLAPVFPDNNVGQWYYAPIQAAADACILQGDDNSGRVRPAAFMNRAEMIVMAYRASQDMEYGVDCGSVQPAAEIDSATAIGTNRIRLRFDTSLDVLVADDADRYTVTRVGGSAIAVDLADPIDSRTVELRLENDMAADTSYRVNVNGLATSGGLSFNDVITFTSLVEEDEAATITNVSVLASDRIRLEFSEDIDNARADDFSRYTVERASGGGAIDVDSAVIINDRTVELDLESNLATNTSYIVSVDELMTDIGDVVFSDTAPFSIGGAIPDLISVTTNSSTRMRLFFNDDLNEAIAEDESHYRISTDGNDSLDIGTATMIDDDEIELVLDESLQSQREYTVTVSNLRTDGGVNFSDSRSFVFGGSTGLRFEATLTGSKEVPSVTTNVTGTGTFLLTDAGLQYDITVRNLSGSLITAAHFHTGAPGVEGSPVESINFNGQTRVTGVWVGLTTQEREDLLNEDIYVNIHTAANPDGEIRSQVEID